MHSLKSSILVLVAAQTARLWLLTGPECWGLSRSTLRLRFHTQKYFRARDQAQAPGALPKKAYHFRVAEESEGLRIAGFKVLSLASVLI